MQLNLNTPVVLADGTTCKLNDIVVDPIDQVVTHLVVTPRHHSYRSRLVPIDDVEAGDDGLHLDCAESEFERYPYVEMTTFISMDGEITTEDDWEVGFERVKKMPSYSADYGQAGDAVDDQVEIVYDRIPEKTVEIRRESSVYTTDGGKVGHVDGFATDDAGGVTHVLLGKGHLWGRRDIAVPIGSVEQIGQDEIWLNLSKDEVDSLPHTPVSRRH